MTVTELEVEAGVREKQETHRSISVESKVCQERNRKKKMLDKGNRLCGYLIEWDRLAKQSKKKFMQPSVIRWWLVQQGGETVENRNIDAAPQKKKYLYLTV